MFPAEEKLSVDLDKTEFKDLKFPVVNNVEAKEMTSGEKAREALKKQVTSPVLWHSTMLYFLRNKNIQKYAEIGSGRVLSGLIKRTAKELQMDAEILNFQNLEDISI